MPSSLVQPVSVNDATPLWTMVTLSFRRAFRKLRLARSESRVDRGREKCKKRPRATHFEVGKTRRNDSFASNGESWNQLLLQGLILQNLLRLGSEKRSALCLQRRVSKVNAWTWSAVAFANGTSQFYTEYAIHGCFVQFAQFQSSGGVILKGLDLFGREMALSAAYIWQQPEWGSNEYFDLLHDGLDGWEYLSR